MTPRARRSAVILTAVVIASAVPAATRALAGPAPAGPSVSGRARDGGRTIARPVIGPILGPVAGSVTGPGMGWAVPPVAGPGVGWAEPPVTGPVAGPGVGWAELPVTGPVAGPGVGWVAHPITGPDVPDPADPFRWPLDGRPRVVVAFDPPAQPWLPGHRGVDLAATSAQPVYAAGPGTVAFAGRVAGVGVVSIDHANGLRTTYEPVDATVRAGDRVAAGTPIGRIGARIDGCPAGVPACLHWGLRHGDVYLDPLALLGLGRVRLLP